MMSKSMLSLKSLSLAALLCCASASHAAAITFVTTPGALTTSAKATFTLTAQTLNLSLTNTLLTPIGSVGQVLTGISFNIASLSGLGVTTYVSGALIDVAGSGSFTAASETKLPWTATRSTTHLDLSVFGTAQPDYGLLNSQANYSSANSSIDGNNPHNPFYQGTVAFKLAGLTGVTALSTITNVKFQFGTAQNSGFINGVSPVPEPASYAMLLAGLALVGFTVRRRRA